MSACASLPSAIWPCGITTPHVSPARAAYAAAEAEVFPVDAQTTTLAPASTAFVIAIVIPRSLNEPVGFAPSIFSQTSRSSSSESRSACSNGVPPSSSVMTGVDAVTGRCSRYASISPGHWLGVPAPCPLRSSRFVSHDPEDRADAVDGLHVAQRVHRPAQVCLAGAVSDEDDPGIRADAHLLHRLDRDVVLAELHRDLGQDAGLIRDFELQVELALDLVDRAYRLARRATRSWRRAVPLTRFFEASMRSPSTAPAVGAPPAPRP